MTKRQFVVLVFRLYSLYLLFNLVTNVSYFYRLVQRPYYEASQYSLSLVMTGFLVFVSLAAITLLWRRSEWLMQKVFAIPALSDRVVTAEVLPHAEAIPTGRGSESEETIEVQDYYETPVSMEGIEVIALSLIGLLEVISALPLLAGELVDVFTILHGRLSGIEIRIMMPIAVRFGIGLFLFLRPWQVQQWIAKMKPQSTYDDKTAERPTPQS